jgi:hypothetical protein
MSVLVFQLPAIATSALARHIHAIEIRYPLEGKLRDDLARDAVYEAILSCHITCETLAN